MPVTKHAQTSELTRDSLVSLMNLLTHYLSYKSSIILTQISMNLYLEYACIYNYRANLLVIYSVSLKTDIEYNILINLCRIKC